MANIMANRVLPSMACHAFRTPKSVGAFANTTSVLILRHFASFCVKITRCVRDSNAPCRRSPFDTSRCRGRQRQPCASRLRSCQNLASRPKAQSLASQSRTASYPTAAPWPAFYQSRFFQPTSKTEAQIRLEKQQAVDANCQSD